MSSDLASPPVSNAGAPIGGSTRFLDRADGRIAYDDMGNGPLVVLVPGLGDLRGEYRFLAPPVAAAGYRVIAMDLRGHGESSAAWPDYATSAIGSDIAALVRHIDAGPAVIVGTSMGAGAAVVAAADAPEKVAGLILIGPFVRDVPLPASTRLILAVALNLAFVGPWGPAAWGAYYASLYRSRKPPDFDAYRTRLVANLREPGRLAALQAMLRSSKADVEPRLDRVSAPALVLMGSADPDFPDPSGEAQLVAHRLRGEVAMIDGVGHYPHAEAPEATVPLVLDFLKRHAA
ncbi:MAG TPA: alpha/beta hydrolase [Bauldia sp.]|nr:alpha/beta hydrolase [Bauldia sp.]